MGAGQRKIFKITLLGDGAVGKTSLRKTYLGEGFKDGYSMTIGADFAVKRLRIDDQDLRLICIPCSNLGNTSCISIINTQIIE